MKDTAIAIVLLLMTWSVQAGSTLQDRERRLELAIFAERAEAVGSTYSIERRIAASRATAWQALHDALQVLGHDIDTEDPGQYTLETRPQELVGDSGLEVMFRISLNEAFGACTVSVDRALRTTGTQGVIIEQNWNLDLAEQGTMTYRLLREIRQALGTR